MPEQGTARSSDSREQRAFRKRKRLEVGAHVFLAGLALYEMSESEHWLRRCFLGACFGWHVGAAYNDALKKFEG
jgi:hypothetical protein